MLSEKVNGTQFTDTLFMQQDFDVECQLTNYGSEKALILEEAVFYTLWLNTAGTPICHTVGQVLNARV